MDLNRAIFHNTVWKLLGVVFTFINNIIIVRMTGSKDSGAFFYSIAFLTFISTIIRFGLENGIVYLGTRFPQKNATLLLGMLPILFIQYILVYYATSFFLTEVLPVNAFWLSLFVMSSTFFYYITSFYQAQKMYFSINIINVIMGLLMTVFFLFVYFDILPGTIISKENPNHLFIAYTILFASHMFALLIYFLFTGLKKQIFYPLEKVSIKLFFSYSFLNYIILSLLFLLSRVDLYFVEKNSNQFVLSNYTQVQKFGQFMLLIPGWLGGVIFPYSIGNTVDVKEKIAKLSRFLTFMFFLVTILVLLLGSNFFTWLLGEGFVKVHTGLLLSMPGNYSLSIAYLLLSYFEGTNRLILLLKSFLIPLVFMITACVCLVPLYGYIAAAIIFSISNCIAFIFLLHSFRKETAFTLSYLFLIRRNDWKLNKH